MNADEVAAIAESADCIVCGYAFTLSDAGVRVLCLFNPASAAVLAPDGSMLETSMDDLELGIVQDIYKRNASILEQLYA